VTAGGRTAATRRRAGAAATLAVAALCVPLGPRRASAASAVGALEATTRDAAASLRATPGETIVVAAPLESDAPAPHGDDLALRVAALLAGKLGGRARAHPQTARLATARAVAGRAAALVFVQPVVHVGELRVTVDVYPTIANAWDRIRNPLPAPAAHSYASAPLDAEVRSFLAPLLLEQARVDHARHGESDVLAAACGDVDGDGGDELLLVSRTRVALGRVRGGAFVAEKTAAWVDLAPRAPVPAREALASAVIAAGSVAIGSTDRGSVGLSADLGAPRPLAGMPAWGGAGGLVCLVAQPAAGAFDGAPTDCAMARDPKPAMAVPAPRFDAFAAASLADARGGALDVVAVREPNGRLRVKRGDEVVVPEGAFGAQLAVADLDEDGAPEVVTTADGGDEAIAIDTLDPGSPALRPRLRLAVPEPVRALAVCPPEDHGEPTLVAVLSSELWLVRAATTPAASP
jgi:hypothetical protein